MYKPKLKQFQITGAFTSRHSPDALLFFTYQVESFRTSITCIYVLTTICVEINESLGVQ